MSEWRFVIAAYAVTWVVVVGYAIHLGRAMRRSRAMYDAARREATDERGTIG